MSVDAGLADWLRSDALYVSASDSATATRWGERAIETELMTPLALKGGALIEATRQAAFLGGPIATDQVDVPGRRHDLVGLPVTIVADRLGYEAGVVVFVIAAEPAGSQTRLTVLRRLT